MSSPRPAGRRTPYRVSVVATSAIGACLILSVSLRAVERRHQTPRSVDGPGFEVASVKPTKSSDIALINVYPGGRLTATNFALEGLITRAYGLQDDQLVGGPAWIRSDGFDIEAKAESNATSVQLQGMLRTLLTERFRLALRREVRELPIYILSRARTGATFGPQLRPSSEGNCATFLPARSTADRRAEPGASACGLFSPPGHWTGRATSIESLAKQLSRLTHRVVVDRTGLSGTFDLDLRWTDLTVLFPPGAASITPLPPPPDGPSLFAALEEQLGLKLKAAKGPVDVFVIEHVERPTPD